MTACSIYAFANALDSCEERNCLSAAHSLLSPPLKCGDRSSQKKKGQHEIKIPGQQSNVFPLQMVNGNYLGWFK